MVLEVVMDSLLDQSDRQPFFYYDMYSLYICRDIIVIDTLGRSTDSDAQDGAGVYTHEDSMDMKSIQLKLGSTLNQHPIQNVDSLEEVRLGCFCNIYFNVKEIDTLKNDKIEKLSQILHLKSEKEKYRLKVMDLKMDILKQKLLLKSLKSHDISCCRDPTIPSIDIQKKKRKHKSRFIALKDTGMSLIYIYYGF